MVADLQPGRQGLVQPRQRQQRAGLQESGRARDLRVANPLNPFPTPTEEEIDYIRTFAPQHCIPREIMMELAIKKFFEFAGGKRKGKAG